MELRSGQHLSGLPPALAASAERIRVLSRDGDMPALAALLQGARPPLACPCAACSCRALRPPTTTTHTHTHHHAHHHHRLRRRKRCRRTG